MTVQIFLVQTQDIKQIFGLFNVKNAVRHFRFSIVKQRLLKLGTGELKMSNDIKTGDFVICVEMQYYGVSGVVIKQYCPTACEEQTMIRDIDGREFHAPTRCFIKVR